MLVEIALDKYYREHIAVKAAAPRRVEYAIEALKEHFTGVELHDVDIPACREYRLSREGISDGTVRRELGTLQAAANHCLKWRHIGLDGMPSIELPDGAPPKTIWLYKDELKLLADAASGRALRFILLAYYTAGRKRSIETLGRSQIDFETPGGRINLSKPGEIRTKKRRPIVPIAREIYDRLVGWLDELEGEFLLENTSSIRPEFDKAAKAAGLEYLPQRGLREAGRLTPHILRHSRATHLLQDKVNPFAVANLLGDNLQTVLKVYGHACPDYLAEVL